MEGKKEIVVPVKKSWQSKTNWIALITAALALFYKPAWVWVEENPQAFMYLASGVTAFLRFISKGKIEVV